jgi:two-component system, NtrC family, sensor kinase
VKLSWKHFLAGGVLVAALVLFYLKTTRIVYSEHEQFDRAMRRLRQLDAELNQDVLKAHFGLLEDYDRFPEQIEELKRIANGLSVVPSFVSPKGRELIGEKVRGLAGVVTQKDELLESFKSQNAVLNNSLRYFPLAGTELAQPTLDPELLILVNNLTRRVLVYSLNAREDQAREITRTLEKLGEWRSSHRGYTSEVALASFTAHAHSIVNRKPKVAALTRELVSVPVSSQAEVLLQLYGDQFAEALRTEASYRMVLNIICGLLVLGIIYTIYALYAANSQLERRVQERTSDLSQKNHELQFEITERQRAQAELEVVHRKMIDVSRQAGMAEVATGVLHNVGNVLNSINVSSSQVAHKLKKSKASNLSRVVALLRTHEADLGNFMANDPKGRQLPAYLAELSDRVAEEQSSALKEVAQLQKDIDHIKDIVAMQQGFAMVSGVVEPLRVNDLVEDALRMNSSALVRHHIHIIKDLQDGPAITTEKHKVLQILVNLVSNAKHACHNSGELEHKVTIRVRHAEDRVRIEVTDNGVGIPPENLTRIFNHGFTTRSNGHGFGLHSGALAAKELGGSLSAHSDGPGCGATFTVELPRKCTVVSNN